MTQVAHNFAADLEDAGRRFRLLIRDRDTKLTASSDEVSALIGVETITTSVRSPPRANVFAQRFVRSVRNECLDHLLLISRRHLEQVLDGYVRHYNKASPCIAACSSPSRSRVRRQRSLVATSSAASSTSTTGPRPERSIRARPACRPAIDRPARTDTQRAAVTGASMSLTPAHPAACARWSAPHTAGRARILRRYRVSGPFTLTQTFHDSVVNTGLQMIHTGGPTRSFLVIPRLPGD